MRRFWARAIYYPTLAYNAFLGRGLKVRRWWDHVDERLILGAVPFRRDAGKLQDLGVTGVVNMCEEFDGLKHRYTERGIEQLWLPTTDFHHPAAELVDQGAEFIQRHLARGGCVYVHCKAGRARSATVVCWWLIKYRGMTPAAAQAKILAARPHANPYVYLRPVIQELVEHLETERKGRPSSANG